ncbi:MAG: YceI family protein [Candidatus Nanopelagicales bacterium]
MSSFPAELTGSYTVDDSHSSVGFVARHAMVTKVRGKFNEYSVNFTLDADNPENSSAKVEIQVASVDTGNEQRDGHLRTNEFFDLENYPTINFESTSIKQTGDDSFDVTGNLQIKDVTKEITIPFTFEGQVTDPWGNLRVGFEGGVDVNRKDWNIVWNNPLDGGGVLVGDKVRLEFDLSAVKNA